MRDALVHARMALNDLKDAIKNTEARLATERRELETVRRRRELARGIGDQETVAVAERFAAQHTEKVAMLETKLMAQQQELMVTEHEYESMSTDLRRAMSGIPLNDTVTSPEARAAREIDELLQGDTATFADTNSQSQSPTPRRSRAEKEAEAEARLSELKRRMGK